MPASLAASIAGLISLETKEGKVNRLDLYLASVIGSGLAYVPPRGVYLPHAALRYLMANPEGNKKELARSLALDDERLQSVNGFNSLLSNVHHSLLN